MVFTFENRVPLMCWGGGASVVWHLSVPLMNSFNKTEAAICPMQRVLTEGSPFFSVVLIYILILKSPDSILEHRFFVGTFMSKIIALVFSTFMS